MNKKVRVKDWFYRYEPGGRFEGYIATCPVCSKQILGFPQPPIEADNGHASPEIVGLITEDNSHEHKEIYDVMRQKGTEHRNKIIQSIERQREYIYNYYDYDFIHDSDHDVSKYFYGYILLFSYAPFNGNSPNPMNRISGIARIKFRHPHSKAADKLFCNRNIYKGLYRFGVDDTGYTRYPLSDCSIEDVIFLNEDSNHHDTVVYSDRNFLKMKKKLPFGSLCYRAYSDSQKEDIKDCWILAMTYTPTLVDIDHLGDQGRSIYVNLNLTTDMHHKAFTLFKTLKDARDFISLWREWDRKKLIEGGYTDEWKMIL